METLLSIATKFFNNEKYMIPLGSSLHKLSKIDFKNNKHFFKIIDSFKDIITDYKCLELEQKGLKIYLILMNNEFINILFYSKKEALFVFNELKEN